MPLSKHLEAYTNERVIWQTALVDNGLIVECGTKNAAVVQLQRLHMFRTLDRKSSFDGKYTVFDDFAVRHPNKGANLVIEKRAGIGGQIVLKTPTGQPASVDEARQQIAALDNHKADQYISDIGLDPTQINPANPLDLE